MHILLTVYASHLLLYIHTNTPIHSHSHADIRTYPPPHLPTYASTPAHTQLDAPTWSNGTAPIPIQVTVKSYIGTSVKNAQLTVSWTISDGGTC